jgi:hypothetical protein
MVFNPAKILPKVCKTFGQALAWTPVPAEQAAHGMRNPGICKINSDLIKKIKGGSHLK